MARNAVARLLLPLLIITTAPAPAFAEAKAPPLAKEKLATATGGTVMKGPMRPSNKSQGLGSPRPGDAPGEALLYYHGKRSPDGGPISPSQYDKARAKAFKMARYSTALGRQLPSREEDAGQGMAAFLGGWEFLGPNNIGGRTRAFYLGAGGELYAAGVSGGVFRSTTSGETWDWTEKDTTPGQGTLPNSAVSAMIVQPGYPNDTIIAGTGEGFFVVDAVRGNGIYKSTDSGATWTDVPGTKGISHFQYVYDLVESTVNTNWFYAATRTGVWRWTGGLPWVRVYDAESIRGGVTDLVIRNNASGDELYAAVGMNSPWACGVTPGASNSKVVRISNAQGESTATEFTIPADQLPAGGWARGRTSLAYAQATDTLFALISRRPSLDCVSNPNEWGLYGLYKLQNPGSQTLWTRIVDGNSPDETTRLLLHNTTCPYRAAGKSQGWYDNVIAVEPSGSTMWVGGVSLFRSSSPFTTWGVAMDWVPTPAPNSPYVHEDQHAISFEGEGTIFVANDGGVFRSDNRGATTVSVPTCPSVTPTPTPLVQWTAKNSGYGTAQFYHGSPLPDGASYFGGTQDNAALRCNGCQGSPTPTWVVDKVAGGDAGYSVVLEGGGPQPWVAGIGGVFCPLGGNCNNVPGSEDDFLFIAPFARDPGHATRVWAGGKNPWRNLDPSYPRDWEKATGTPTPTATPSPTFWPSKVSAIGISHNTGNIVAMGREDGMVAWTSSALNEIPPRGLGPQWSDGTPPPRTGFISSITMDPGSCSAVATCTAYVTYSTFGSAGESQVYRTDTGGTGAQPWTGLATEELQGIPVHTLVVDPDSPMETGRRKTLYIGTDLGVYVSFDRGNTWLKEETGFPDIPVESLRVNTGSPRYLFAFTHGRGAYRVPLCHPTGPPVVTAPADITVDRQTDCTSPGDPGVSLVGSVYIRDHMNTSYTFWPGYAAIASAMEGFLHGAVATQPGCSYSPGSLGPRLGSPTGELITDYTVFPGGQHHVYFVYQNEQGIGYDDAWLTVRNDLVPLPPGIPRQGNLDNSEFVDVFDVVTMASHIVGNIPAGTPPFTAPHWVGETVSPGGTYNGTIDLFDLQNLMFGIVNSSCLTPPPQPPGGGSGGAPLDAMGTASVTATATTTTVPSQAPFSVDVGISLTNVTMTGCAGDQVACVLGGYEIPLQFDKTLIEYVSTTSSPYGAPCGGSRPAQYSLPTATSASLANANGVVAFTEENGADPSGPTGGPYCYFRINLKAKKVLTDRYTNLWFHSISSCAIRGGAPCGYSLATPGLACAPNPDQGTTSISKNEDIVIPIHIYVP